MDVRAQVFLLLPIRAHLVQHVCTFAPLNRPDVGTKWAQRPASKCKGERDDEAITDKSVRTQFLSPWPGKNSSAWGAMGKNERQWCKKSEAVAQKS